MLVSVNLAVVEGPAQAIVNGDVPAAIRTKRSFLLISLDLSWYSTVLALKKTLNLVNEVKEQILSFFVKIHQILGAGSTGDGQGSLKVLRILKPALSRVNEVKVNAPSAGSFKFFKVFVIFINNTTTSSCQMKY